MISEITSFSDEQMISRLSNKELGRIYIKIFQGISVESDPAFDKVKALFSNGTCSPEIKKAFERALDKRLP